MVKWRDIFQGERYVLKGEVEEKEEGLLKVQENEED